MQNPNRTTGNYLNVIRRKIVGRVAQSVSRLATGWMVWGSNPGGARFFARPDRPWGPPSLLYNGYRVFPGCKVWPGRAADRSPPSNAVVMEEYNYTSTNHLGHNRACNGNTVPLPLRRKSIRGYANETGISETCSKNNSERV